MEKRKITCPYDKSHIIYEERFARHLTLCERNHPNSGKVRCPFNVTHVMEKSELNEHVKDCSSRATYERIRNTDEIPKVASIDETNQLNQSEFSWHKALGSSLREENKCFSAIPVGRGILVNVKNSSRGLGAKKTKSSSGHDKGIMSVGKRLSTSCNISFGEEDWDAEPDVASYNPQEYATSANVIRHIKGGTPSERKVFRSMEQHRLQNLAKNRNIREE